MVQSDLDIVTFADRGDIQAFNVQSQARRDVLLSRRNVTVPVVALMSGSRRGRIPARCPSGSQARWAQTPNVPTGRTNFAGERPTQGAPDADCRVPWSALSV